MGQWTTTRSVIETQMKVSRPHFHILRYFLCPASDENESEQTWVAGYPNDVMAWIPSRRVLAEGGDEGADVDGRLPFSCSVDI